MKIAPKGKKNVYRYSEKAGMFKTQNVFHLNIFPK